MTFKLTDSYDMIQKTCGYDHAGKHENIELLVNELMDIFLDQDSMRCFLNCVALSMTGRNNFKQIDNIDFNFGILGLAHVEAQEELQIDRTIIENINRIVMVERNSKVPRQTLMIYFFY